MITQLKVGQVVNESPEIFSCRVILLGPGSESVLLFEVPIIQPAFMVITLIVAILRQ